MNGKRETITVKNLTTGYRVSKGEKRVTNALDATLYSGELTCLLGPNGAGKSTLLRTLAGFQKPLSGVVSVSGRSLDEFSGKELARTIGVVLTERPKLENMDVETLVGLGRAPYTGFWGKFSSADKEAVEKALALTGIEDLRHRMVQSLSDGERQKAMIAKAFAQETPVIFLDEPTAFLDYPSKVEIMMLLYSLAHRMDKTIFMSTHDLDMAMQLSDRIWLMDKRLGVRTGTHEELTRSGDIERYFVRPGIKFDRNDGLFKIDLDFKNGMSSVIKRGESS
ncbi:MAG: ABC transporter ATP-binding protein [Muribaculaceae bacterium]|nr:ABC transporter ATP-binding protein [Muribaculaceae bacterium]